MPETFLGLLQVVESVRQCAGEECFIIQIEHMALETSLQESIAKHPAPPADRALHPFDCPECQEIGFRRMILAERLRLDGVALPDEVLPGHVMIGDTSTDRTAIPGSG